MLAVAIVHDTTFVARGYAGDIDHLKALFKEGIATTGLSIIEVLQPCITWGGHPMRWYKERIGRLEDHYDPQDRQAALEKISDQAEKLATGVLYRGSTKPVFAERFRKTISGQRISAPPTPDASRVSDVLAGYIPSVA